VCCLICAFNWFVIIPKFAIFCSVIRTRRGECGIGGGCFSDVIQCNTNITLYRWQLRHDAYSGCCYRPYHAAYDAVIMRFHGVTNLSKLLICGRYGTNGRTMWIGT
jgi:hypothetical protein